MNIYCVLIKELTFYIYMLLIYVLLQIIFIVINIFKSSFLDFFLIKNIKIIYFYLCVGK